MLKKSNQRFRVGDRVRIEKHKHTFEKGYLPRFTDEIFTVAEVRTARNPTTYKLRDDQGEMLTGWFYTHDLCLVLPALNDNEAPVYNIEKVLKRKNREGKEYCFVKWKGYSNKHNSWIPATSII